MFQKVFIKSFPKQNIFLPHQNIYHVGVLDRRYPSTFHVLLAPEGLDVALWLVI
jgi:hypothetical protein